jgi:hypothetical protein
VLPSAFLQSSNFQVCKLFPDGQGFSKTPLYPYIQTRTLLPSLFRTLKQGLSYLLVVLFPWACWVDGVIVMMGILSPVHYYIPIPAVIKYKYTYSRVCFGLEYKWRLT